MVASNGRAGPVRADSMPLGEAGWRFPAKSHQERLAMSRPFLAFLTFFALVLGFTAAAEASDVLSVQLVDFANGM